MLVPEIDGKIDSMALALSYCSSKYVPSISSLKLIFSHKAIIRWDRDKICHYVQSLWFGKKGEERIILYVSEQ